MSNEARITQQYVEVAYIGLAPRSRITQQYVEVAWVEKESVEKKSLVITIHLSREPFHHLLVR